MYIRTMFQSHSHSIAVHTTHEQAKQAAHGQKLLKCLAVDGTNLQHAQNDHVNHHGPFSTKLVTGKTKARRTNASQ